MPTGLYSLNNTGTLVPLGPSPYDAEAVLQELLANHPELLAGGRGDHGSRPRFLLVQREAGIGERAGEATRWSVDHLFVDDEGVPTLVEVKRSTDTRIRREVVGQMLDYAANSLVYWPVAAVRELFERCCEAEGIDAGELLAGHCRLDAERFWRQVGANLEAGRIRMVVVADEIPRELRRVVEFLNGQLHQSEVLALEVRRFASADGASTTLTVDLIGDTEGAARTKAVARGDTGERERWTKETFFTHLAGRVGPTAAAAAQAIFEQLLQEGFGCYFGRRPHGGLGLCWTDPRGTRHWLASIRHTGKFDIQTQTIKTKPPFTDETARRQLLERVNEAVPGADLETSQLSAFPAFPVSLLEDAQVRDRLVRTLRETGAWIDGIVGAS